MNELLTILASAVLGSGAPPVMQADVAWIASGEFCEPETVLALPDDTLLVSNVCGFKEPGSGFLTLLAADGGILDWHILNGLDAPLGMTLSDNQLYVVDNNQLKIFSWPDYELVQTLKLETAVANDVAVTPTGIAFVTDTAGHQVIEVQADGTHTVLTGEAQFTGANGIEFYENQLYVGGSKLWRVDTQGSEVEILSPEWLSDIDGIEFEADGTLQVTPVAGPLIRFPHDQEIEILSGEGISSANHGYSHALKLALIPTGYDNTVIAIRINQRDGAD